MMRKTLANLAVRGLILSFASGLAPAARAGEQPPTNDYLGINRGLANVIGGKGSVAGGLQYVGKPLIWTLRPHVGGFVTHRGAVYGYAGLGVDIQITDWAMIRGNTAIGACGQGDDRDLGHVVQFRSGVELVFVLPNEAEIGIGFHHLSNAGIGEENLGTEIATISYSVPLDKLF